MWVVEMFSRLVLLGAVEHLTKMGFNRTVFNPGVMVNTISSRIDVNSTC
jgi:hypothetical protein